MAHFRSAIDARAGQFVPSTYGNLINKAEEKIHDGEILKPSLHLHEYGLFKNFVFHKFFYFKRRFN